MVREGHCKQLSEAVAGCQRPVEQLVQVSELLAPTTLLEVEAGQARHVVIEAAAEVSL